MTSSHRAFDALVTVASWEPRFILGLERTLEKYAPRTILSYFLGEYGDRTVKARCALREISNARPGTDLHEQEMTFDAPDKAWRLLEAGLGPAASIGEKVIVDLTTMPREIIWGTLFWLEARAAKVHYVYNQPKAYSSDWLARDPNDPRLVYKLAGTLEVGRPTALVAVTGFDEKRCRQAVEYYEPVRVLLAVQTGQQYGNDRRNVGQNFVASGIPTNRTEMDAYCADHGYSALRGPVQQLAQDHNVILCCFGPKPSAIALFRLQREFPQCALAYIGCKEYSPDYSSGLGDLICGSISWL